MELFNFNGTTTADIQHDNEGASENSNICRQNLFEGRDSVICKEGRNNCGKHTQSSHGMVDHAPTVK